MFCAFWHPSVIRMPTFIFLLTIFFLGAILCLKDGALWKFVWIMLHSILTAIRLLLIPFLAPFLVKLRVPFAQKVFGKVPFWYLLLGCLILIIVVLLLVLIVCKLVV